MLVKFQKINTLYFALIYLLIIFGASMGFASFDERLGLLIISCSLPILLFVFPFLMIKGLIFASYISGGGPVQIFNAYSYLWLMKKGLINICIFLSLILIVYLIISGA